MQGSETIALVNCQSTTSTKCINVNLKAGQTISFSNISGDTDYVIIVNYTDYNDLMEVTLTSDKKFTVEEGRTYIISIANTI